MRSDSAASPGHPLQRKECKMCIQRSCSPSSHRAGVIHRHLKPSNVLIALDDGKPVPKVIDLGVGRNEHVQGENSRDLYVVGTITVTHLIHFITADLRTFSNNSLAIFSTSGVLL